MPPTLLHDAQLAASRARSIDTEAWERKVTGGFSTSGRTSFHNPCEGQESNMRHLVLSRFALLSSIYFTSTNVIKPYTTMLFLLPTVKSFKDIQIIRKTFLNIFHAARFQHRNPLHRDSFPSALLPHLLKNFPLTFLVGWIFWC